MASCSPTARLTGEPLQLFTTQNVRWKSSPSRTRDGWQDRPVTSTPSSSRSSRTKAPAFVSSGSTWPPGTSQTSGYHARSHLRCTRRTLCSRTRRPPTHTRTAIRNVFSAQVCSRPLHVPTPGEEVFRMAEVCDTSMSPEARMFAEIELGRKEAHHGVASRAVAGWARFQGSVGRGNNRHFVNG
jgi:hypothetical protein